MSDMDKRKIKIGLIGFGSWVRRAHLPALEYDGRAIITAAAAATENKAGNGGRWERRSGCLEVTGSFWKNQIRMQL
ncbi:MAG: hypothetical protein ACLVLH_07075 [Eisenbergiella massiliensis]